MLSDKLQVTLPWRVPVILYASHNDFLQTNIQLSLIPEGVQAFAEPSRKRIVLPFTGSFPAFAHTAIHELAHVFTFQIVYNRLMDNVFSRNALFGMPLWIAEGFAEYLAVGWDAESDMFIRDAVIHDYLPDLSYAYGFMVYKGGQAAFNYIEETYGREKVLEIVEALSITRSADGALERTIGLNTREFSEKWLKAMRKHYWPMYGDKAEVSDLGRRLTNHIKERGAYNVKPVMSPDGERIAFFSDRGGGLISIYVMSTIDGKIQRKLVTGQKSDKFESLHFYTSSLAWGPNGDDIAFVAKSGGRDKIYIVDSRRGRVKKKIDIKSDGLASPTWSPQGDRICVSAVFGGQTDLLLVDVKTGDYKRLTYDTADQLNPRFFPDGRRIAFGYHVDPTPPVPDDLSAEARRTLHEMDFLSENVRENITLDIWEMDLESLVARPLVETEGDDQSPVVFDGGRKMAFTSDVTGIRNLYIADLETGNYRRVTDILSGVHTPDVNEANNRVTFAAFVKGGYDIYVSDELDELMRQNFDVTPTKIETVTRNTKRSTRLKKVSGQAGIPLATVLSKATPEPDVKPDLEDLVYSVADEDSGGVDADILPRGQGATVTDASDPQIAAAKVSGEGREPIEGLERPVTGDEPVDHGASVKPYRFKLAPDYIGQGGGLYFSTGFGFGLANTIALSDMLGNHRAVISFNIYRDIADSDLLGVYYYLKKRINYGLGAFQYKNYLNSRVTSVGEAFSTHQLFTERNYGVFGLISYPFDTFNRVDLELTAFVSERQFFEEQLVDPNTGAIVYQESARSTRHLIEPTVSFVHDASFYSYFGPIDGSRYMLSVSKGFGVNDTGVSRSTLYLDYRKYKKLFHRNSIAVRGAFAASEGEDPRNFFIGGPSTLRGYDYLSLSGTRFALFSLEYRFPFLDALIFGWPGRWGFGNMMGSVFFDAGATWNKSDFSPFERVDGFRTRDLLANVGGGLSFYFGYMLLNFQLAYQTDLETIGHSQFYFFIGPGW
jgi:Tol biopolymer transport system component